LTEEIRENIAIRTASLAPKEVKITISDEDQETGVEER